MQKWPKRIQMITIQVGKKSLRLRRVGKNQSIQRIRMIMMRKWRWKEESKTKLKVKTELESGPRCARTSRRLGSTYELLCTEGVGACEGA